MRKLNLFQKCLENREFLRKFLCFFKKSVRFNLFCITISAKEVRKTEAQEKSFKTIFEKLLSERVSDELSESMNGYIKKKGKKISAYDAMAMVQLKKALDGDPKAFELIRETLGQKSDGQKDRDFGGVVKVLITDE